MDQCFSSAWIALVSFKPAIQTSTAYFLKGRATLMQHRHAHMRWVLSQFLFISNYINWVTSCMHSSSFSVQSNVHTVVEQILSTVRILMSSFIFMNVWFVMSVFPQTERGKWFRLYSGLILFPLFAAGLTFQINCDF